MFQGRKSTNTFWLGADYCDVTEALHPAETGQRTRAVGVCRWRRRKSDGILSRGPSSLLAPLFKSAYSQLVPTTRAGFMDLHVLSSQRQGWPRSQQLASLGKWENALHVPVAMVCARATTRDH